MNKEMYERKVEAVGLLSEVIKANQSNVEEVRYEVYQNKEHEDFIEEFIVVKFIGNGMSVRTSSGNSFSAIFREIGKLLDGSYYGEIPFYLSIAESDKTIKIF